MFNSSHGHYSIEGNEQVARALHARLLAVPVVRKRLLASHAQP